MDFFYKNERVRSYSIYEHDPTLKIAFGAFFLAKFNAGPPNERCFDNLKGQSSSVSL